VRRRAEGSGGSQEQARLWNQGIGICSPPWIVQENLVSDSRSRKVNLRAAPGSSATWEKWKRSMLGQLWFMVQFDPYYTRYMDKVIEKIEQHAELLKMVAVEGYDVVLLPVVLGRLGHSSNALIEQHKKCTFPMPEKINFAVSYISTTFLLNFDKRDSL
jgi:hypothetical protein